MIPSEKRIAAESAPPGEARQPEAGRRFPVTFRAVGLGLFGAVVVPALQVAWTVNPRTAMLPFHSYMPLFAGAVFWLFLLAIINVGLRRWFPRRAFQPAEFAVIYGITTVAASITGWDEAQFLWPM